jgi:hypothetical protein
MKIEKKLTIILISYKSEKKIYTFVKKIPKNIKVIIIENSKNTILKKNIEKKYRNINVFIKKNQGVSNSINYAVKKMKTEYFLQISPDIQFDFNKLKIFFEIANKMNNKFSALGPKFMNRDTKSHRQIGNDLEIGPIDSIHGSFMFINKKRYYEIGKFDENFFLYFEETDFCKRGLDLGLKAYQINRVKVKTQGRTVTINNKKERNRLANLLTWHFIWSKYYFKKKNYGRVISIIVMIPTMFRAILKIIYYKLTSNNKDLDKYKFRLAGLISSIIGKKSHLRP